MMSDEAESEWSEAVELAFTEPQVVITNGTMLEMAEELRSLRWWLEEKWGRAYVLAGIPALVVGLILGWCVCQIKHLDHHPAEPAVIRRVGEP